MVHIELLAIGIDGDDSESIAEYVTIEEGLDDLVQRIRNAVTGNGGEYEMSGYVCLADIEGKFAYVNVICDVYSANRDEKLAPGHYSIVSEEPETRQEFETTDAAFAAVVQLLHNSIIEDDKPISFTLYVSNPGIDICDVILTTFEDRELTSAH